MSLQTWMIAALRTEDIISAVGYLFCGVFLFMILIVSIVVLKKRGSIPEVPMEVPALPPDETRVE